MNKRYLSSVLLLTCLAFTTFQSCKKESALGIDNDKVVKIPFSLYAANSDGALISSTDGDNYVDIFPPDGYPTKLIFTAGPNLLFLKANLHCSDNDGQNFNPVNTQVKIFPWQSMAYYFKNHGKAYISSNLGKGIAVSEDNGKTWKADEAWAPNPPPSFEVSSFAGLSNTNELFSFSNKGNILFRKSDADANWTPVTAEGFFPVNGTRFYLTSNASTLFLIDYNGLGGAWYSDDSGNHWIRIGQGSLPLGVQWNCANSPQGGHSLVVGTDKGAYKVTNDQFETANGGFDIGTSVYSITSKSNTYKNDAIRTYVFIGTSKGIYRSEDFGRTWDKMTYSDLNKKYVAVF